MKNRSIVILVKVEILEESTRVDDLFSINKINYFFKKRSKIKGLEYYYPFD